MPLSTLPPAGQNPFEKGFRHFLKLLIIKAFTGGPGGRFSRKEPPWGVLYGLVLGNLLFWIALFTLFTWMFR